MKTQTTTTSTITIEQMEQALRDINFFVGGLTDEQIVHYYNKTNQAVYMTVEEFEFALDNYLDILAYPDKKNSYYVCTDGTNKKTVQVYIKS